MINREVNFTVQLTEVMKERLNAPGGIRTHGPRIRNPVLYPLSYGGVSIKLGS